MHIIRSLPCLLSTTILGAVPGVAMAQTQTSTVERADPGNTPEATADRFGDIVVTATRREERLQDVPVAISAFNPDTLAQQGITKAEDLTRVTPSLSISRFVGNPAATSFGIRGQRTSDIRAHSEAAVVVYMAEVPQKIPIGIGVSGFLDLRSIEVLRGPQGTLFGKNSTGGAVLLVPSTPTDEFEGNAKFTLGNFRKLEGQAVVNLPLGEGVGLRLAGVVGRRDPWYKNRTPGLKDFNSEDYVGSRGSFQFETGALTSTFYGDYVNFKGSGQAGKVTAVNPAGLAQLYPLGTGGGINAVLAENQTSHFWSSTSADNLLTKAKVWGVSNTTTYQISDELLLKNIVGYRYVFTRQETDADGTPFYLIQTNLSDVARQLSEEFQIQYNTTGFRLIGGAFYFRENARDGLGNSQTIALQGLSGSNSFDIFVRNRAKSVFLEGTYDITPQLHLTLGGRYTWDSRYRASRTVTDFRGVPTAPEAGTIVCRIRDGAGARLPLDNCFAAGKKNFRKPTFNVTLQYEFSGDSQAYASWRRGYRAGGFSLDPESVAAAQLFYRPETVDTYEVGYKGEFDLGAASALRLNLAGYYSKYDDIQKSQNRTLNGILITETLNAAKATIYGLETEVALSFGDHVKLNGSYTYTHAKYDEFLTTAGDLKNTPFGFVPKHKLTGTARFELPAADGLIAFQPTVTYQSSQYVEELPARDG